MGQSVLLVLRTIHILAAVFWVGGVLIVGLFIMPGIRAAGAGAQPVLAEIMMRRKLGVYLPASAMLSMLAGFALYYHNMKLSGGAWAHSSMGVGISAGVVLAIVATVFGMGISGPAARKLAMAGGPQAASAALAPDERQRLQKRAEFGSMMAMTLLTAAAIAMSVARYL